MFQIMVVDDDRNTRRLLQAVLEADGYKVLTAENGEDALALMDSEYVDLVVLDIMMPKMDGYEFTRTLRETNNNLPVLMVSAKELPSDKKHGFLVGTDDYMTKPIDEEEMLWRIKALLRRAKIASERRIVVGDVVLDYDCLTVSRKGGSAGASPEGIPASIQTPVLSRKNLHPYPAHGRDLGRGFRHRLGDRDGTRGTSAQALSGLAGIHH